MDAMPNKYEELRPQIENTLDLICHLTLSLKAVMVQRASWLVSVHMRRKNYGI